MCREQEISFGNVQTMRPNNNDNFGRRINLCDRAQRKNHDEGYFFDYVDEATFHQCLNRHKVHYDLRENHYVTPTAV